MADIIFGPFSLDFGATRLLRDGREIRLRPQGLLALRVLLRHGGDTVRYEQMIQEAWNGTNVSRHTVDVTISEIRKTLGEFGGWIVNKPKLGYRIEVPRSDELVRRGWHFWNRRTREADLPGREDRSRRSDARHRELDVLRRTDADGDHRSLVQERDR